MKDLMIMILIIILKKLPLIVGLYVCYLLASVGATGLAFCAILFGLLGSESISINYITDEREGE